MKLRQILIILVLFAPVFSVWASNRYETKSDVSVQDTLRYTYRYYDSIINDEDFPEGSTICIDIGKEAIYTEFEKRISLKWVNLTKRTGEDSWVETWLTHSPQIKVQFEKSLGKGVTAVRIEKWDNIVDFVPLSEEEIIPSGSMPDLFINAVEFANVSNRGRVIDDYGQEILASNVKNLYQRIRYQISDGRENVTFGVRFIPPTGKLLQREDSPEGYSYISTFSAKDVSGDSTDIRYLGCWKGSMIRKGGRMEIYDGETLLVSVKIPVKGKLVYVPIIDGRPKWYANPHSPRNQREYRDLYYKKYTGYWRGHYITGWKVFEVE